MRCLRRPQHPRVGFAWHDSANATADERWTIQSKGNGFFQILCAATGPALLLDGSDANDTVAAAPDDSLAQDWEVRSLGSGEFQLVNRPSGQPVSLQSRALTFEITPAL